ncbi:hypothetical protein AAZX31_20G070300 [Glycine max]
MHSVTYNQDLVSTTLLVGWTELRDFYELTRNHQVTLTHFGQSVFLLTIIKSSSEPKAYPKWNSLYHQVPNPVTFRVLFIEYKVTCSSLVVDFQLFTIFRESLLTTLVTLIFYILAFTISSCLLQTTNFARIFTITLMSLPYKWCSCLEKVLHLEENDIFMMLNYLVLVQN